MGDLDKLLFLDIDDVVATDARYDATAAALGLTRRQLRERPLTPDLMPSLLSPEHVSRVQRVCEETGAGFVLVTSWLDLYTVPEDAPCHIQDPAGYDRVETECRASHIAAIVSALRGHGLAAPYLGALPAVRYKMSDYAGRDAHRRRGIVRWLAEHPCAAWCVLDDDTDGRHYGYVRRGVRRYHQPLFEGHCVHPVDGVTDADAALCIEILNRK